MRARVIRFGEIEIDGERYTKDVVIEGGAIRKREKQPSRAYKQQFGHTPLSIHEDIPWDCARLIVGTGVHGRLPVMDAVRAEAERRGVDLIAEPTPDACERLNEADLSTTNAILHLTC